MIPWAEYLGDGEHHTPPLGELTSSNAVLVLLMQEDTGRVGPCGEHNPIKLEYDKLETYGKLI